MHFEQIPPLEPIRTYIINLEKRPDRKKDAINEFSNRSEFKVSVVKAIEDSFGALGLWKTLCLIIKDVAPEKPDYILICEDDHKFTRNYSEKKLRENIEKASLLNSDILLGGVSWSGDSIVIDQTLFWTKSFSGLQFTIIFKKFFDNILNAKLDGYNAADYHICDLSQRIFLIHPFISIQRSYKYSDVTPMNNELGRVKQLFLNSESKLKQHRKVSKYFSNPKRQSINPNTIDVSELMIPTYIINLRIRTDRRQHITSQFDTKIEFKISYCDAVHHNKGQIGLWESIKKVIKVAQKKGEDVILITEDDHLFTDYYNKNLFIRNVIKAHSLGADIMLGGISNYQNTVRASENLFWIDEFYCTQFMIVYKRFFKDILSAEYDENMSVDGLISSISSNKMVIYPFASVQKDFGYSDITIRDSSEIRSTTPFYETMSRFELLVNKQSILKT
jgi:GR25 family glycosyltransferase involved in LPS biosynthesis